MKAVFCMLVLCAGVGAPASGAATEAVRANLLCNSSFAVAANPGFPDYWGGQSSWRPDAHGLVDEGAVPGTKSFCLSNADGKAVPLFSANYGWSPGKPGTVYAFSVWLRSEPAGCTARIGGDRLDHREMVVSDQWEEYAVTGSLEAAKGYAARFLRVGVTLLPRAQGKLYVSAPVLVRGENPGTLAIAEAAVTEDAAPDPSQALVAEWDMAGIAASGSPVARDTSGHGHDGSITGTVTSVETPYGQALAFDGRGCMVVPYTPELAGSGSELTLELLLAPQANEPMPVLIRGMHYGGYALRVSHGNYDPILAAWNHGPGVPALPAAEHLVVTFKRPVVKLYLGGTLMCQRQLDKDLTPAAHERPLVIGGWDTWSEGQGYHPTPGFRGWIRLVRIYDRALSADQVARRYRVVVGKRPEQAARVSRPIVESKLAETAPDPLGPLPELRVPLLRGAPPVMDGHFDDPAWQEAARIEKFVRTSRDPAAPAAAQPTTVYMLRDEHVLYVGAHCYDAEMESLNMKDWFEVFMADPRLYTYYHFWVHPSGDFSQDGAPGAFLFQAPQWTAKTSRHAARWDVEMAIPFFNLSSEPFEDEDGWRFNVCREKVGGQPENSQWSNTGGYFHVPDRFGRITGMKGASFVPDVHVAAQVKQEDTSRRVLPDYLLLDRSYYTSETTATCQLHLSADTLARCRETLRLTLTVSDPRGTMHVERTEDVRAQPLSTQSFDLAALPVGTYEVTARVAAQGRVLGTFHDVLRKLPPHPNEVKINRISRLLLVNGKPFIPQISDLMFWGERLAGKDVPADALATVGRESGFNTVFLWYTYPAEAVAACAAEGMMVIPAPVGGMKRGAERVDSWRAEVEKYKDAPNLLAWFLADEGNLGCDETEFAEMYKELREVDPYHPFFRNESGWIIGCGGPGGLDTTDIYCGGYGGGRLIDAINLDGIPRGTPSLAGHAWFGVPESIRYPTPEEETGWFYELLIHGACGGFRWGVHDSWVAVPELRAAVRRLRRESDWLAPVLNTVPPAMASVRCEQTAIHFTTRHHEGRLYLVAVNTSTEVVDGVFTLPSSGARTWQSVTVKFEDREVPVAGQTFADRFEPHQRHVYELALWSLPAWQGI